MSTFARIFMTLFIVQSKKSCAIFSVTSIHAIERIVRKRHFDIPLTEQFSPRLSVISTVSCCDQQTFFVYKVYTYRERQPFIQYIMPTMIFDSTIRYFFSKKKALSLDDVKYWNTFISCCFLWFTTIGFDMTKEEKLSRAFSSGF